MAFRLGFTPALAAYAGRVAGVAFADRVCPACVAGAMSAAAPVQDAWHACFECPVVREGVRAAAPPFSAELLDARDFASVFQAPDGVRGALRFVDQVLLACAAP